MATRLTDADVVLLEYRLPDAFVILLVARPAVESAIEIVNTGAYDRLSKPFDTSHGSAFDAIIGMSPSMQRAKALLKRASASPASTTVLLTGETGTGKNLAARAIHYNSPRAAKPLVTISCSTLPEHLLESELFGRERDTLTGAQQQKRGMLETAEGGTVFLDEIDEVAPGLQAKLVRFLEKRTFKRIGGLNDIRVDVRVVAATTRDLEEQVMAGTLRGDLFYRLQVEAITLPALRERKGDIPLLVDYYVNKYNREFRKHVRGLAPETRALLDQYRWPGNVRELRNVIERAMLLTDRDRLLPDDLPALGRANSVARFSLPAEGMQLDDLEKQLVEEALARAGGNRTRAGRLLGISRDQVRYRIEKFGLDSLRTTKTAPGPQDDDHPLPVLR